MAAWIPQGWNARQEPGRLSLRGVPPAQQPGPWKERGSFGSSCENPSNLDKNSRGLPYPLLPMGLDIFVCSALKLRAIPQTLS